MYHWKPRLIIFSRDFIALSNMATFWCLLLLVASLTLIYCFPVEETRTQVTLINEDDDQDEIINWNKEDFPNPLLKPFYCNRARPSYVCDPDDLLSKSEGKKKRNWRMIE